MWTSCESQRITKIRGINHQWAMNVCTKVHVYRSNRCWDISVRTEVIFEDDFLTSRTEAQRNIWLSNLNIQFLPRMTFSLHCCNNRLFHLHVKVELEKDSDPVSDQVSVSRHKAFKHTLSLSASAFLTSRTPSSRCLCLPTSKNGICSFHSLIHAPQSYVPAFSRFRHLGEGTAEGETEGRSEVI